MGVTVTNTRRDGDLCVVAFSVTAGTGNVTTTENIIGHINQIGVTKPTPSGSDEFSFTLEDTANGMRLFTGTVDSEDISTSGVGNGSGAFCRGPLKFTITVAPLSVTRTLEVYYEKM